MVKSCIREYASHGFRHPLKEIEFSKTPIAEAVDCNGVTFFETNTIKIRAPTSIGLLQACSFGGVISHELAHHLLQEWYWQAPDSSVLGNDLVHFATNDPTRKYLYQRRYWSPTFLARYGLPYLKITYFDLPLLVRDRDLIMAAIRGYSAPQGKDVYWR